MDQALDKIAQAFEDDDYTDYVYGSVQRITREGKAYELSDSLDEERIERDKFKRVPFQHPSMYIKKDVYEKIGLYNLAFRINADYDFMLRLLESDFRGKKISLPVVKYRDGGVSGGISTFLERRKVWKKYGVPFMQRQLNAFNSIMKLIIFNLVERVKNWK
jgi:hypothetical protein